MENSPQSRPLPTETEAGGMAADLEAYAPKTFAHYGLVGELFSITLVNLATKVVTLGIYHFWAKSRVRRYVWSQTSFGGERFEYTGQGIELLRGFVMSLVLVAPFIFVWGFPQFGPPETVARHAALLRLFDSATSLYLFFMLGLARYSSRRYLLGHTRWRGIRFALTGSAAGHGWKMLGYSFLLGFTGGLYTPFMRSNLMGRGRHALVDDDAVSGQQQAGYRCCVLQSEPGHLCWINHRTHNRTADISKFRPSSLVHRFLDRGNKFLSPCQLRQSNCLIVRIDRFDRCVDCF